MKPIAALVAFIALGAATHGASPFTTGRLFNAQALVPPPREDPFPTRDGKPEWTFAGKDRGNVTFFSEGFEKVQTSADGALKFALAREGALLGWGEL